MHYQSGVISQNLSWRCSVQNYVKYSFIKGKQCRSQAVQTCTATVTWNETHLSIHLINNGSSESGKQVGLRLYICVFYHTTSVWLCACVCASVCPLQSLEANGAEEEDGVEQHETESQPAVQLPVVQVDTQDLKDRKRAILMSMQTKFNLNKKNISNFQSLKTKSEAFRLKREEEQAVDVWKLFTALIS